MAKLLNRSHLERCIIEGDNPVDEDNMLFLKRVGLLELEV